MANQVVNLLHYRSLNLGEVPVNVEFGQIAINTFNGIHPVEPTLHDVSLFIGTGGDARVDEDGTDRTADVLIASVRTGEAPQSGKGWVRYQMRNLRASGDTMVGDLLMSGASIRFVPGASGNAELVLPTETAANVGEVGSIRYNTSVEYIQYHDGAAWVTLQPTDFQIGNTAPTLRVDGNALSLGDLWYDSLKGSLHFWNGASWTKVISQDYDFQIVSGLIPALRGNGIDPLVTGDWWYDNSATVPFLFFWDGTQWTNSTDGGTF